MADDTIVGQDGTVFRVVEPGDADDPLPAGPAPTSVEVSAGKPEEGAATSPTPGETEEPEKPVAAAAPETEAESDEDLTAPLERLEAFIEEELAGRVRAAQSGWDKRIDSLKKEHTAETQSLREELRQTQLQGLSAEQKAALTDKWSRDDERKTLDEYKTELDGYARDVLLAQLLTAYAPYGIKEADLEGAEDNDDMTRICLEKKAEFLERRLEEGPAQAEAPPKATAAKQEEKPAPAGAKATTDLGGAGATVQRPEIDLTPGFKGMGANYKNLPVETVRIGRRG